MRVKLSSVIISLHVEHGLVEERDDLEVGWGTEELDTLDRTVGDETSAAAWLRAPSNFLGLGICNGRRTSSGCPDAPVCDANASEHDLAVKEAGTHRRCGSRMRSGIESWRPLW